MYTHASDGIEWISNWGKGRGSFTLTGICSSVIWIGKGKIGLDRASKIRSNRIRVLGRQVPIASYWY